VAGGDPPTDDEAATPPERAPASPPPRFDGNIPSGFARKYLELTPEEQAMVQGYVEGLAAGHQR